MSLLGSHIVVLGAGVVGLQTAVFLLEAGCKVTVIAEHIPGDESAEYTSPWAGAQWRTHAKSTDQEQRDWDTQTYEYWMKQLEEEQRKPATAERSGLGKYTSLFYWADSIPVEELWWAPLVRSFRALPDDALPPRAHSGVAFNSVTVNTMKYLAFLVRKVRSLGGRIIRFRVPTKGGLEVALKRIEELLEPPDLGDMDESSKRSSKSSDKPVAYVNCTGMGARVLVPDSKMYPIRGQTILVKGEASCIRTLEGFDEERKEKYVSYVIPRKGSGTTILGGTKQEGNWHVEADEQTTKDILQRCRELAPELLTGVRTDEGGNQQDPEEEEGEFEVVRVNVGLRPAREGGARVELDESIGNGQVLVHCYGHAGAGYQNSVGAARKVIGILEKRLRSAGGNITEGVKAKI